jgi:hypothetical protein
MGYFERAQAPQAITGSRPNDTSSILVPPVHGAQQSLGGSLTTLALGSKKLSFVRPQFWESTVEGFKYAGNSLATRSIMWSSPDFGAHMIASYGSTDNQITLLEVIQRHFEDARKAHYTVKPAELTKVQLEDGATALSVKYLLAKGEEIHLKYGYFQQLDNVWCAVHFLKSWPTLDATHLEHEISSVLKLGAPYLATMRLCEQEK